MSLHATLAIFRYASIKLDEFECNPDSKTFTFSTQNNSPSSTHNINRSQKLPPNKFYNPNQHVLVAKQLTLSSKFNIFAMGSLTY